MRGLLKRVNLTLVEDSVPYLEAALELVYILSELYSTCETFVEKLEVSWVWIVNTLFKVRLKFNIATLLT
jgi:hypothetical protein